MLTLCVELLDETQLIPKKFLKDLSGTVTTIVNPDYLVWKLKEKALVTFISSTLTPSILTLTMGCHSAMEVWRVLENHFSSISRSHIMNLKGELHNIRKGTDSVDLYLQKIKIVRDKLMAVGVILDDEELLHIALKCLPKDYNAFRSAIRTKITQLSFDELTTLLNAKEESLNDTRDIKDAFAMAVNTTSRLGGYNQYNQLNGRGRGRNGNRGRGNGGGRGSNYSPHQFSPYSSNQNQQNQFSPSQAQGIKTERPTCQICGKIGHLAIDCYHRMDYAFQGNHPPTKLATMAIASNATITQDQPWLADSAATDLVTSSLNALSFPKPYTG